MTTQRKALLGLVSVVPLLVFAGIVGPMIYFSFSDPGTLGKFLLGRSTIEIIVINVALLVGSYGPVIYYLYHIAQNPTLRERRQILIFLVLVAVQLALPVYWFLFIWNAESETTRV
jgi:hypothetical protein